jgi:F-type H+-transporting ATPase subunit delta
VSAAEYPKGEELARKYAEAAYQHTTEGWLNELSAVWDRLSADSALLDDLSDTKLSFAERQARLDVVLPPDLRADVKNFLYVLLREGHIGLLGDVVADLSRLATRGLGAQVARVTSAMPLTPDELEAFRQRIHAQFGGDVDLDLRVDPSILGGVVVQVGDKVIDGSVAGKLNALHERLVAVR